MHVLTAHVRTTFMWYIWEKLVTMEYFKPVTKSSKSLELVLDVYMFKKEQQCGRFILFKNLYKGTYFLCPLRVYYSQGKTLTETMMYS